MPSQASRPVVAVQLGLLAAASAAAAAETVKTRHQLRIIERVCSTTAALH